jgi:WD40 repeat protein
MRFAASLLLLLPAACHCSNDGYYAAAWSPDGALIAIGTGESVRLENARTRKLVRELPTFGTVHAVQFGADGKRLLFAGRGNTLSIADLESTRDPRQHPEINPIVGFSVAVSRDGKTVLSAGTKSQLLVWKAPFKKPVRRLRGAGALWQFALTSDGKRAIATSTSGHVNAWDVNSGKRVGRIQAHGGYIFALAMSADGSRFATGGSAGDHRVRVWNTRTLREERSMNFGTVVRTMAFSPNGKVLAVGGNRRTLTFYAVESGKTLGKTKRLRDEPSAIAFSPNGQQVLITSAPGRATVLPVLFTN